MADAKKSVIAKSGALKMASEATKIIATKGKKIVIVDLAKDKPDAEYLASLMLGPSGNLRAPTARIGTILLIGFNEEMYRGALDILK